MKTLNQNATAPTLIHSIQSIHKHYHIKLKIIDVRYYQYMCRQSKKDWNELHMMLSPKMLLTLTLSMKFNMLNNFSQKLWLLLR